MSNIERAFCKYCKQEIINGSVNQTCVSCIHDWQNDPDGFKKVNENTMNKVLENKGIKTKLAGSAAYRNNYSDIDLIVDEDIHLLENELIDLGYPNFRSERNTAGATYMGSAFGKRYHFNKDNLNFDVISTGCLELRTGISLNEYTSLNRLKSIRNDIYFTSYRTIKIGNNTFIAPESYFGIF